jgi:hypothetical protein
MELSSVGVKVATSDPSMLYVDEGLKGDTLREVMVPKTATEVPDSAASRFSNQQQRKYLAYPRT